MNCLYIFVSGSEEDTAPRTDDDGGCTEDITSVGNNIGEIATSSGTPGHDKPSVSSRSTNANVDASNTSKTRKQKSEMIGAIQPPNVVRPRRTTVPVDRLTVGRSTESNRQAPVFDRVLLRLEPSFWMGFGPVKGNLEVM